MSRTRGGNPTPGKRIQIGQRTKAAAAPRPSSWRELQSYLAGDPLDDMISYQPEIAEALALLKHAGPTLRYAEQLTVALRLLVEVSIKVARDIHYLEPNLVKAVNLLHEHIHEEFGLMPGEGRWHRAYDRVPRSDPAGEALCAALFGPPSGGERNHAQPV